MCYTLVLYASENRSYCQIVLIDMAILTKGFNSIMWPQRRWWRRWRSQKYHMYFPKAAQQSQNGSAWFNAISFHDLRVLKENYHIIAFQHAQFPKILLKAFALELFWCWENWEFFFTSSIYILFFLFMFLCLSSFVLFCLFSVQILVLAPWKENYNPLIIRQIQKDAKRQKQLNVTHLWSHASWGDKMEETSKPYMNRGFACHNIWLWFCDLSLHVYQFYSFKTPLQGCEWAWASFESGYLVLI